jgi:uncharacterized protein (TIGR02466 family)
MKRPDLLEVVKKISEKNLIEAKSKSKDEIFPVYMSENFFDDPEISEFNLTIRQISWSILNDQGYNMGNKEVFFTEMWTQEHYKHSLMEQHTHKFGSQIVGFYFLETPENCSRLLVHDPRPGKTIIGLDEFDVNEATEASDIVNFTPEPGLLVFTNGWLPHSFSRHMSDEPIKFVHFNLGVSIVRNLNTYDAPIII